MGEYYRTFNDEMAEMFSQKVYKLSLDGGMTCPNRDGTVGTGGCIFCSEGGSGDFSEKRCDSIDLQIEKAKNQVSKKFKGDKYIAYFQSYTNTYADINYLESIFYPAINNPSIVALSIGTRPDCLEEDVLALLGRLNKIKPVYVELGLQTSNEQTARLINRGYTLDVFDNAMTNLKATGVKTVVHIILGLPHETKEDMARSVKYVVNCGADGIKLQLLHVLKGTELEKMYLNGEFETFNLDDYVNTVCDMIALVPKSVTIHRITGDAPKKLLVSPTWSADKKRVLNAISRELKRRKENI
jgi:uncharacterized protein